MIRNRILRRAVGLVLIILGGFLIWMPVSLVTGVVLVSAGLTLEGIGLYLERNGMPRR